MIKFQIKGNSAWRALNKQIIKNKIVDIVNCVDNYPHIGPAMFNAEILFVRGCDNNHQYYWLIQSKFPNIKQIYIDTYFEPEIYCRFTPDVQIYLTDNTMHGREYIIKDNKVKIRNRTINIITNDYLNCILNNTE